MRETITDIIGVSHGSSPEWLLQSSMSEESHSGVLKCAPVTLSNAVLGLSVDTRKLLQDLMLSTKCDERLTTVDAVVISPKGVKREEESGITTELLEAYLLVFVSK